ncbi:glyoxalase [Nocardioides marmorisolisilvae]|uniref:Glyoxalase n=1 Tax=Nocardioides marmorisolisilvae TaxID=1542737 RepID=A0A3N0DUM0_9ACTN|nr:glyoxalase [Nocardioides marmorisolisilvae]RNL79327.1 glyoxalase [Nocardioides marmorisolisilvae]
MGTVDTLVLEVEDVAAAQVFYKALGVEERIEVRETTEATSGFRGFTVSLVCSQPGNVDAFVTAALDAGATTIKPAAKSFWGYGAVLQAPDGTLWKVAASSKKDTAPVEQRFEDLVLLLGVTDVKATKQFYADRGLGVAKSFGSKYVEFDAAPVKLALYGRKAAAKDAGVSPEGSGSHRLAVLGSLGAFADPDGFVWESR